MGKAKFTPGDQVGAAPNEATHNLPVGELWLPSHCSGSYLRDTGLSDADEQLKQQKLLFSSGSYNFDFSPEENLGF